MSLALGVLAAKCGPGALGTSFGYFPLPAHTSCFCWEGRFELGLENYAEHRIFFAVIQSCLHLEVELKEQCRFTSTVWSIFGFIMTLGLIIWNQDSTSQISSLSRGFVVLRFCLSGTGYKIRLSVTKFQAADYYLAPWSNFSLCHSQHLSQPTLPRGCSVNLMNEFINLQIAFWLDNIAHC